MGRDGRRMVAGLLEDFAYSVICDSGFLFFLSPRIFLVFYGTFFWGGLSATRPQQERLQSVCDVLSQGGTVGSNSGCDRTSV